MLMFKGNHLYILLGLLSFVLVTEAFGYHFWAADDVVIQNDDDNAPDQIVLLQPQNQEAQEWKAPDPVIVTETVTHQGSVHQTVIQNHHYPHGNILLPVVQDVPTNNDINVLPVVPVVAPAVGPVTDQIAQVTVGTCVTEIQVDSIVHVAEQVAVDVRKIKFMSTTDTVTVTAVYNTRRVITTTPTYTKTDTTVIPASKYITQNYISEVESLVTETVVEVQKSVKPMTMFTTISTPVTMYLTVEAQTVETELEPFTITNTVKRIETVFETLTETLTNQNSIVIPVVELITETATLPYTAYSTQWITSTVISTLCQEW